MCIHQHNKLIAGLHPACAREALRGLLLALGLWGGLSHALAEEPSIAFFYGANPPVAELSLFDQVVLEPGHAPAEHLAALARGGAEAIAYVSVGEVSRSSAWRAAVKPSWRLARNEAWDSDILDPTQEGWRAFLLQRMDELWRAGFRGFFLDTLDSPLGVKADPAQVAARREALAGLIRQMHERFPTGKLLLNRGFELLPDVAAHCAGVAAESLFQGWDAGRARYTTVSETDRAWLLQRLNEVKERFHLPVVVIDYVPPSDRELARQTAAKIAEVGFTPWVTNAALDQLGIGSLEPVPRRVLALYDGEATPDGASNTYRFLQLPLEYHGYTVDLLDVRSGLPTFPLVGRYAGIVSWFTGTLPQPERYREWLARQMSDGMRVAILGQLGFTPDRATLARMGLGVMMEPLQGNVRIAAADALVGFEARPAPHTREAPRFRVDGADVQLHLGLSDDLGRMVAAVVTAPWGGMALDPYLLEEGYGGRVRWVLEPFDFLREALQLPALPAPDVTTENGSRVMTVQVEGDGFALRSDMQEHPFSGKVVAQFLEKRRLPVTVSFIEGELSPAGLHPELSDSLEDEARRIAKLPWVELASHSFSHPASWPAETAEHLAVGGDYRPNAHREVAGSVAYVKKLAPAGKDVGVFSWPGDGLPDAAALREAAKLDLVSVSGGYPQAPLGSLSVAGIRPVARRLGDGVGPGAPLQLNSPGIDGERFVDNAPQPLLTYDRVIEILQLTETPRRLKPLSLSFHFGMGVKVGSMKAIERVYAWAQEQGTLPLWTRELARRVEDFDQVVLARRRDGGWELQGLEDLRTVRLSPAMGWPDLARSEGVVAVRDLPQGRYVGFDGRRRVTLQLTHTPPATPYLVWANARLARWEPRGGEIALRLTGHVPVRLAVAGAARPCQLKAPGVSLKGQLRAGVQQFDFTSGDTGDARLACP